MLLNNQEITEEIKEEIKKYLETNDKTEHFYTTLHSHFVFPGSEGITHSVNVLFSLFSKLSTMWPVSQGHHCLLMVANECSDKKEF